MNREFHPVALLDGVLDGLIDLPEFEAIGIWMLDESTEGMILLAGRGPDGLVPGAETVRRLLLEEEVTGVEVWATAADSEAWGEAVLLPLRVEGVVTGTVGVAVPGTALDPVAMILLRTVTDCLGARMTSLRRESKLRLSRAQVDTLFDLLDDYLFICSPDHEILLFKAKADRDSTGTAADGILGGSIGRILPEALRLIEELEAQFPGPGRSQLHRGDLRLDGLEIPVKVRVTAGRWSEQDVYYVTCRDVSDRLTAELELERLGTAIEPLRETCGW